MFPQDYIID